MKVRFSHASLDDLADIFLHGLTHFGLQQAERYREQLDRLFDLLEDNPYLGPRNSDLSSDVRVLVHKNHIILYRVEADGVLILRVRHGREDWRSDP
jgi:toxin ParE1/3/4